uniref:Nuclease HARBI1 n=1 Tax=Diabrotica virgifera virgifera TaxID=50390 RepID=A0A6P7FDT2_DIAVI
MFKSFSNNDLAVIALCLDEEEHQSTNKKPRIWVHNILKTRKTEGEFFTLYEDLCDDETKFFQYFRMTKYKFYYILNKISADLTKQNTTFREAITPIEKLVVCLRFLSTGDSFRTIAFSYRLGHSTTQEIVGEVCKSIIKNLLSECMPIPAEARWKEIANEFWNLWNFPNCLGALDGKHVEIVAPANSGSNFFNYKRTFSVVLLGLVDAHYKFIAVDIGSYGKNSDGGIFASSNLGKALEQGILHIPEETMFPGTDIMSPYVIIGDSAFPLKTNLMRPYPEPQANNDIKKRIFNYRLCRSRRVVENAFGILAQKFRIYMRKLNSKPGNVENIILATCILHNFLRDDAALQPGVSSEFSEPPEGRSQFSSLPRQGGNAHESAFLVRETFKDFFNSDVGSVPWQIHK